MDRLGVGVIGLGWWGDIHARIYSELPQANLVALCSRTESRAEELATRYGAARTYTDYRELVRDPEIQAVSVVTRESEHFGPAMAAIEAGKHVLLEKPITEDFAEAVQIVEAAREAHVHVMPGFTLRFETRHALVKERIEAGELGEILYVRARRNIQKRLSETYQRVHPAHVASSHDVDQMLWYVKDKVVRVRGYQRTVGDYENPNMVMAVLEFAGGAVAYVESIWLVPDAIDVLLGSSMEVIGSKGIANIDFINSGLNFWEDSGYSVPESSLAPIVHGRMLGSMREELYYFVDSLLRGEAPTIANMEDALHGHRVVDAIIESATIGKDVEIVQV